MKNLKKKIAIVTMAGALVVGIGSVNVFASTDGNMKTVNHDSVSQCVNDSICDANNAMCAVKEKAHTKAKATKKATGTSDSNYNGTGVPKHDGSGNNHGNGEYSSNNHGNGEHNGNDHGNGEHNGNDQHHGN